MRFSIERHIFVHSLGTLEIIPINWARSKLSTFLTRNQIVQSKNKEHINFPYQTLKSKVESKRLKLNNFQANFALTDVLKFDHRSYSCWSSLIPAPDIIPTCNIIYKMVNEIPYSVLTPQHTVLDVLWLHRCANTNGNDNSAIEPFGNPVPRDTNTFLDLRPIDRIFHFYKYWHNTLSNSGQLGCMTFKYGKHWKLEKVLAHSKLAHIMKQIVWNNSSVCETAPEHWASHI